MSKEREKIIEEIEENFLAISKALSDIDTAFENSNEVITKVIERIKEIEEYVINLPTPDKTFYKPRGSEEYLNYKHNLDYIYDRIDKLEKVVFGETE